MAWSIDDFAYNLKVFTPERMQKIIAAQREKNPNFAFAPCVYYKHATPVFAKRYGEFLDGILFPYRSESTKAGFADATQVAPEVRTIKERFGHDFLSLSIFTPLAIASSAHRRRLRRASNEARTTGGRWRPHLQASEQKRSEGT